MFRDWMRQRLGMGGSTQPMPRDNGPGPMNNTGIMPPHMPPHMQTPMPPPMPIPNNPWGGVAVGGASLPAPSPVYPGATLPIEHPISPGATLPVEHPFYANRDMDTTLPQESPMGMGKSMDPRKRFNPYAF